jgi:hypothetical protein
VAEILRSRPSLTARIAFAPPEAIHAIAAFLYLAPEAAGSDAEVGTRQLKIGANFDDLDDMLDELDD